MKSYLILFCLVVFGHTLHSYTLSALKTDLGYALNEPTPIFWTAAERTSWLNQGQYDFIDKVVDDALLDYLVEYNTFTVTGIYEYALPSDYLRVYQIRISSIWATPVMLSDIKSMSENTLTAPTTKNPYFYLRSGKMGFFPTPVVSTSTITVWYLQKPTEMVNDTDTAKVPVQYSHIIVMFAEIKALEKLRDYTRATSLLQEYILNIKTINDRYMSRHMVEPASMQKKTFKETQKP